MVDEDSRSIHEGQAILHLSRRENLYHQRMEYTAEWVKAVRRVCGFTQQALADELNCTKGNVSGWENGRHMPSVGHLIKIAELSGRSKQEIDFLLGLIPDPPNSFRALLGEMPPYPEMRDADGVSDISVSRRSAGIPVVGAAQLGDNGHFVELEYPVGHGDGYIDFPSADPNAYAVRCTGDSMTPRIRNGEFVVVEPNHEVQNGDEVLVKARDGRVMVKQFLYRRDGRVHLLSMNEIHPPVVIDEAQVDAMHYVSAIAKAARWVTDG